jgi:sulfite exporter TauE/SafE
MTSVYMMLFGLGRLPELLWLGALVQMLEARKNEGTAGMPSPARFETTARLSGD